MLAAAMRGLLSAARQQRLMSVALLLMAPRRRTLLKRGLWRLCVALSLGTVALKMTIVHDCLTRVVTEARVGRRGGIHG